MNRFFHVLKKLWLFSHFSVFLLTGIEGFSLSLSLNPENSRTAERKNPEKLFENNDIIKLTVLSDFSSIMKDRGEDRSYHKGLLYYITETKDTVFRKVKLKTRGNFRRNPTNCRYPPIMVKFGKLKTADSVFTDQSKLKLVTQCQLENYILLEYLAYRIFNVITDQSYRVRLAHITYADLKTKESYFTRYAFFIENEKEIASRIGAEVYKPNVVQYFLDQENVVTMAMFQYLIGNDDWYVTSKHNVSILKQVENDSLIAVPYDFDWSKLVNAKYTKPVGVTDLFLKDRRIYKGLCLEKNVFEIQKDLFKENKEAIIGLLSDLDDLPKGRKQEATKYIEKFYKTLEQPSSLEKIFQKEKCISKPIFK